MVKRGIWLGVGCFLAQFNESRFVSGIECVFFLLRFKTAARAWHFGFNLSADCFVLFVGGDVFVHVCNVVYFGALGNKNVQIIYGLSEIPELERFAEVYG